MKTFIDGNIKTYDRNYRTNPRTCYAILSKKIIKFLFSSPARLPTRNFLNFYLNFGVALHIKILLFDNLKVISVFSAAVFVCVCKCWDTLTLLLLNDFFKESSPKWLIDFFLWCYQSVRLASALVYELNTRRYESEISDFQRFRRYISCLCTTPIWSLVNELF